MENLRRRYRTIKIPEFRYVDLVRLRAWLELKFRRRVTFDEVLEYLFDNLPEEARELDLESADITVKRVMERRSVSRKHKRKLT